MKALKIVTISLLAATLHLFSAHALADDAMKLAKKSGCFGCHAIDKTIVGPAWNDVSAKYKGDKGAHDKLVHSVKIGSEGKWGKKVHMKAHPDLADEDIVKLVDYILSLND
jgi:cytochrome c